MGKKIKSTAGAWESGRLGRNAAHAKPAPKDLEQQVDDSLGLQLIWLRVRQDLVDEFERAAKTRGLNRQSLMREALESFTGK